MTPEEQRILRETLELSRETNELVKKMYRGLVWSRVAKIVYWVVIIGVAVGAFYFLQPYVDGLRNVYSGITNSQERFRALIDF